MVSRPGIPYVSLSLSLSLSFLVPNLVVPQDLHLGTPSFSISFVLSHLLSSHPPSALRIRFYIHPLCFTPIIHHRASLCSLRHVQNPQPFCTQNVLAYSLGPRSGPRSSVRMVLLRFLALGAGLGSVWLCCKSQAEQADVGCAINCADFVTQYRRGVQPYWLHIAYHGPLDFTSWQDRLMGAMRILLETLLRGEDVAVHCKHGSQIGKECLCDHRMPHVVLALSMECIEGPRSIGPPWE